MLNFKKYIPLKIVALTLAHVAVCSGIWAQDSIKTGPGIGFHIQQYQRDFGIGLQFTSPFFLKKYVAVRLRASYAWHEHATAFNTLWTPYPQLALGVVGVGGMIGRRIRLYGEGGGIVLFPAEEFSKESTYLGGYGHFGFEFFMTRDFNYYIELGGVGTGAIADKVAQKPFFSNGFTTAVGFRYFFNRPRLSLSARPDF
jgi:hypothetical protein